MEKIFRTISLSCFLASATTAQAGVTIQGCGDGTSVVYDVGSLRGSQEVADCEVVSVFAGSPIFPAVQFNRAGSPTDSISMVATDFCSTASGSGAVVDTFTWNGEDPITHSPLDFYVITGSCEDPAAPEEFCCVIIEDSPGDVATIGLSGTTAPDNLNLRWASPETLYPLGSELTGAVWGADGNDDIEGSMSEDAGYQETLYGGDGRDYINGRHGNDTIYGNGDDDYLVGWFGVDTIYGGDGDDFIVASDDGAACGAGVGESVYGGGGNDDICTACSTNVVDVVHPASWYVSCWHWGQYMNSTDYNTVHGGDGNDIITGSESREYLYGDAGNDDLIGNGNADWFSAGTGGDTMTGSSAADIYCFIGNSDTITDPGGADFAYSDSGASWTGVALGAGSDTCAGNKSPNFGCDSDIGSYPACPF